MVKEGVNGFFAITEEEWIANLERFRGNLTSALGAAARQTLEESFSFRATVPKIAEILPAEPYGAALTGPMPSRRSGSGCCGWLGR